MARRVSRPSVLPRTPPHAQHPRPLQARDAGAALEALQAAVLLEAEAPTTLTAPLPLSCACKPRACTCDKTCYCHIRPSTYAGDRLAPPAVDGGGLPAHAPLHNCACNVGSVGGYSFEAGNSVDCDCAQAQCTCTQACDCPQAPT